MRLIISFVLAGATSCPAWAEGGFTMNSSAVVTLRGNSGLWYRAPGATALVKMPPPLVSGDPDFRSVFAWGVGAIDVTTISIGLDTVRFECAPDDAPYAWPSIVPPTDPDGHSWIALMYAVDPTVADATLPDGQPPLSDLDGDDLGKSLFGYLIPGSTISPLVDGEHEPDDVEEPVPVLVHDPRASYPGPILGVDWAISLYQLDPEFRSSEFLSRTLPANPTVYFTIDFEKLSPPTKATVQANWFKEHPGSSATILRTTWQSGSGSWTSPEVWLPYDQVAVAGGVLPKEAAIAGLSIDDCSYEEDPAPPGFRMLFSLRESRDLIDSGEAGHFYVASVVEDGGVQSTDGSVKRYRLEDATEGDIGLAMRTDGGPRGHCESDPFPALVQVPGMLRTIALPEYYAIATRDRIERHDASARRISVAGFRGWLSSATGGRSGAPSFVMLASGEPLRPGVEARVTVRLQHREGPSPEQDVWRDVSTWTESVEVTGPVTRLEIPVPRAPVPWKGDTWRLSNDYRLVARWSVGGRGNGRSVSSPACILQL